MGQYANELYSRNCSLEYENKALREKIAEYESGQRYLKLQADFNSVRAGYVRRIKELEKELAEAHITKNRVRDIWFTQCDTDWEQYKKELEKKENRIQELEDKYWKLLRENDQKILDIKADYEKQLSDKDEELRKKDAIIDEMKLKIAHLEALQNRDGTNTGTPTSKTPPGKNKVIPNCREKSKNPKGGQVGHEQHVLEEPSEDEINDTVEHPVEEDEVCPTCGSQDFVYTGNKEYYYEYDVKISIIKRRYIYFLYQCLNCGEIVKSAKGPDFRSKCTYGPNIQALALSLMNTVNAPMNKTAMLIAGITNNELTPCDGYIAKLQKRAAKGLTQFYNDAREYLLTLDILYWDDTVVFVNKVRACLRFYGNEEIAFFTAHMKKDLPSVLEDNVLPRLTADTKVMHDHNMINYNKQFHFQNLECDQHLERDGQKTADETGHTWGTDVKELVASTIKERNELFEQGVRSFSPAQIESFNQKLNAILQHGWKEYEADKERMQKYGAPFEQALLNRIEKYRDNYFAWLEDFTLPTINNLSERSLRGAKSKMKIAGQFGSEESPEFYAIIRTYTETCRRHGVNEFDALVRLCEGRPYTIAELFP